MIFAPRDRAYVPMSAMIAGGPEGTQFEVRADEVRGDAAPSRSPEVSPATPGAHRPPVPKDAIRPARLRRRRRERGPRVIERPQAPGSRPSVLGGTRRGDGDRFLDRPLREPKGRCESADLFVSLHRADPADGGPRR